MKEAGFSPIETQEIQLSRFTRFARAGVVLGRKPPA